MSGLVDIWTAEFAKLREKGRDVFTRGGPSGASPRAAEGGEQLVMGMEEYSLGHPLFSEVLRIKRRPPPVLCSDAAVSMLMDCVSP